MATQYLKKRHIRETKVLCVNFLRILSNHYAPNNYYAVFKMQFINLELIDVNLFIKKQINFLFYS